MPPQQAQPSSVSALYGYVLYCDFAGFYGNKTIDSAKQCSLTRATGAEDSHLLSAGDAERHAVQDWRRVLGTDHNQVCDLQYRQCLFSLQRGDRIYSLKTFSALPLFFEVVRTCHRWPARSSCLAKCPESDRPSLPSDP